MKLSWILVLCLVVSLCSSEENSENDDSAAEMKSEEGYVPAVEEKRDDPSCNKVGTFCWFGLGCCDTEYCQPEVSAVFPGKCRKLP